jgi:hypothetical protein
LLPLGKCTGISSPITLSIRVLCVRPIEPVPSERVLGVCPMERALGACPIAVPGPPSERAELGRLARGRGLLFPDRSPGLPTKPSVVWADHGRVRVVMPDRFISLLSDARGSGAYYYAPLSHSSNRPPCSLSTGYFFSGAPKKQKRCFVLVAPPYLFICIFRRSA